MSGTVVAYSTVLRRHSPGDIDYNNYTCRSGCWAALPAPAVWADVYLLFFLFSSVNAVFGFDMETFILCLLIMLCNLY